MKGKNIIIGGIIIALLAATYVWFFVYNKAHVDYQKSQAVFSGSNDEFYVAALEDITSFNEKHLNKAIEITGSVDEIEGATVIFSPGIFCRLAEDATAMPAIGDYITIKGRYVGNDEDLITEELMLKLDQCVFEAAQ